MMALLILAALLLGASYGQNQNHAYKKFLSQHRDEPRSHFRGKYCEAIMSQRGLTRPECKEVNTFIHASKNRIKAVCGKGGKPYGKLRISNQHFKVTTCKLQGGSKRPPCHYREDRSPRYIVIDCRGGLPIHYDERSRLVPRI